MTTNTHPDLLRASEAIGGISKSAHWYTQRLSERITRAHGIIDINDLTIGELVRLDAELRDEVSRAYAEALV